MGAIARRNPCDDTQAIAGNSVLKVVSNVPFLSVAGDIMTVGETVVAPRACIYPPMAGKTVTLLGFSVPLVGIGSMVANLTDGLTGGGVGPIRIAAVAAWLGIGLVYAEATYPGERACGAGGGGALAVLATSGVPAVYPQMTGGTAVTDASGCAEFPNVAWVAGAPGSVAWRARSDGAVCDSAPFALVNPRVPDFTQFSFALEQGDYVQLFVTFFIFVALLLVIANPAHTVATYVLAAAFTAYVCIKTIGGTFGADALAHVAVTGDGGDGFYIMSTSVNGTSFRFSQYCCSFNAHTSASDALAMMSMLAAAALPMYFALFACRRIADAGVVLGRRRRALVQAPSVAVPVGGPCVPAAGTVPEHVGARARDDDSAGEFVQLRDDDATSQDLGRSPTRRCCGCARAARAREACSALAGSWGCGCGWNIGLEACGRWVMAGGSHDKRRLDAFTAETKKVVWALAWRVSGAHRTGEDKVVRIARALEKATRCVFRDTCFRVFVL